MFHSGKKVRGGSFSREIYGSVVDDYMENLKIFSERRWKSLLTACGIFKEGKEENPVPSSSMSHARHALYIPSSP
jgi:hypothetical protein